MKKVYIAGPWVFRQDVKEHAEYLRRTCLSYGFEALLPVDFESNDHLDIKINNQELIRESDYVIADCTPFRGVSMDVGTAYEVGYTEALDKIVCLWSSDKRLYEDRIWGNYMDEFTIEPFKLKENIMIDNGYIAESFEQALHCLNVWEKEVR